MEFLNRRKRRYSSSNDKHFGPLTFSGHSSSNWRPLGIVFDSGDDDESPGCHVRIHGFGRTLLCELPPLIQPFRVKHIAQSWTAATVERLGRNWHYETHSNEFGFTLSEGFLQVFLGPQTHDSTTTKSWSKHLPWTQWRFHRHSYFDTAGQENWTQLRNAGRRSSAGYDEQQRAEEICPAVSFEIDDYDGQRVTARTVIEQREWKFGEGWFKWLSLFRKNLVRRSLKIDFSSETGREKGSWKGGTCGTSIDMLPGELHEAAFRRYCENEHRSKSGNYKVKFIAKAA